MKERSLAIFVFFLYSLASQAQQTGLVLEIPITAKIAALNETGIGNSFETSKGIVLNPAMIDSLGQAMVSYHVLPSSLKYLSAGYVWQRKGPIDVQFSMGYFSTGNQDSYDELENIVGTFSATDLILKAGTSYQVNERIKVGANAGLLYSDYDRYNSISMLADLGLTYYKPNKLVSYGVLMKNIGGQITAFDDQRDQLPFNTMVGLTKTFEHLPFVFHLSYQHLERWNLDFQNRYVENTFLNQEADAGTSFGRNFLRHFLIGTQLRFGAAKSFNLYASFDMNQNMSASIANHRTLSGLGLGFGVDIKRINVQYAFNVQHYIANSHSLTISTDLSKRENFE